MKNKQTDHERIKIVFSAVEGSKTQDKIFKLDKLLNDPQNKSALNSMYFLSNDQYMNILHYLAQSDHCNIILPVIKRHIDSSLYRQQDHEGETPLKSAISAGRLENAKVLVEAQKSTLKDKKLTIKQIDKEIADTVNMQDNKGQTALHRASDFHEPKHIEFLIANGAATKILDKDKNCALIYAVSGITSDVIKVNTVVALVNNFQELNIRGSDGKTALEILRETQKSTWGSHQEKELMRACNKNKGINCTIS